ncbi:MAG TPA: glycosyltransferase [Solirubrobacteraceae bacterium]|nr:glycosyltransferase [Solirubrobacteraceae bacterium]
MRVAVVAEFYPRSADPVLGVWAHRQALAARDAGADVTVFVLHRLVPPSADFSPRAIRSLLGQPGVDERDGLEVHYVRYVSGRRAKAYAGWGARAAPRLARAVRRAGPFDVIHAHNAVPAADAALRAGLSPAADRGEAAGRPAGLPPAADPGDTPGRPAGGPRLVVSVHGGDVLWTTSQVPGGDQAVRRTLGAAALVLANSAGIEALAVAHGARRTQVVHLGTDIPDPATPAARPLVVTVGHLVGRKRHVDVIHAISRIPDVDYLVIGEGPERPTLEALARMLGVADRVEFAGQLPPDEALRRAREAWVFAMPSTDEAFGVAYIEAMAAGIPAIGAAGEPGPEEIGPGLVLVAPRDPAALAAELDHLLRDQPARAALGIAARQNVTRNYTWAACGARTVAAYEDAIR